MRAESIVHFVKRTSENIRLSTLSTVAAVLVATICLILLATGLLVYRSLDIMVPGWISEAKTVVYLHSQSTAHDQEAIVRLLKEWSKVRDVRVISKEQARKALEAQLGEWKGILEGVVENPLPPSIEITFRGKVDITEELRALQEKLKDFPQVEDVLGGSGRVDRIQFISGAVKSVAPWLPAALALIVALAVSGSVKQSLMARGDELELYELLGATQLFSRMPFYLQGVIQGMAGGLLAAVAVTSALMAAKTALPAPIAAAFSLKGLELAGLGLATIFCGGILGWLGASLSMRHLSKL